MPIQQRTNARRLAGEVPPMAIACVLLPCGAFCAAAQRAHDFVIGWMSHLASHTTPRPALPHLACLAPAKPWPSPLVVVVGRLGRLDGVLNIVKSEDGGSGAFLMIE